MENDMATTDNAIVYDIKLVEHLAPHLGPLSNSELKTLKKLTDLGIIQRDRVAEIAMSNAGGIDITSINGMDFSDGTDAKTVVSNARNNNPKRKQWTNSFDIKNVKTKTGDLRVVAYNKLQEKYHYFYIPYDAYKHLRNSLQIVIESYTSILDPNFTGKSQFPQTTKYWEYECASFEEMCQMSPAKDLHASAIKASARRTEYNTSDWFPLTDSNLAKSASI